MIVDPRAAKAVARAAAVCEGCPSRGPCLDYALADPDLLGVWAGTTEHDRARLRRAAS